MFWEKYDLSMERAVFGEKKGGGHVGSGHRQATLLGDKSHKTWWGVRVEGEGQVRLRVDTMALFSKQMNTWFLDS